MPCISLNHILIKQQEQKSHPSNPKHPTLNSLAAKFIIYTLCNLNVWHGPRQYITQQSASHQTSSLAHTDTVVRRTIWSSIAKLLCGLPNIIHVQHKQTTTSKIAALRTQWLPQRCTKLGGDTPRQQWRQDVYTLEERRKIPYKHRDALVAKRATQKCSSL